MTRTLYLCDGKNCKEPLYCKARKHKSSLCNHTTDPEHAKNGPCRDPWRHPERFIKEVEGKTIYFTEKEDYECSAKK